MEMIFKCLKYIQNTMLYYEYLSFKHDTSKQSTATRTAPSQLNEYKKIAERLT